MTFPPKQVDRPHTHTHPIMLTEPCALSYKTLGASDLDTEGGSDGRGGEDEKMKRRGEERREEKRRREERGREGEEEERKMTKVWAALSSFSLMGVDLKALKCKHTHTHTKTVSWGYMHSHANDSHCSLSKRTVGTLSQGQKKTKIHL